MSVYDLFSSRDRGRDSPGVGSGTDDCYQPVPIFKLGYQSADPMRAADFPSAGPVTKALSTGYRARIDSDNRAALRSEIRLNAA